MAQFVALPRWKQASKKANGRLRNWLNAVANNDYIERLQQVIFHLHKADSKHVESVPVHELFRGQTVWKGVVEVFTLTGHPKAKKAYAWSHREGKNNEGERFVAVLEIPPVESPVTAVRASIVADGKKRRAVEGKGKK
jgi:hypothetical protein